MQKADRSVMVSGTDGTLVTPDAFGHLLVRSPGLAGSVV